jgi:hypothetical protein
VRASVWDSVRASVRDSVYGQHDANWLGFYEYFRDACGLDAETQKLAGLWLIAQSAGWFLPHRNLCWVSERHNVLNRNESGRLHCENGPALAYPDGWLIWAIDGMLVDEQIVMRPETQSIAQIDGEKNADLRSIRIARFGWPVYLAKSGAECLDQRGNDIEGTREALYRTKSGDCRLVATCPTGRVFAMGVPPQTRNCEQAANFLNPFTRLSGVPKGRIIART